MCFKTSLHKVVMIMKLLFFSVVMISNLSGYAQVITTIAGGGIGGLGSPATSAALGWISSLAVDKWGNIYLTSDSYPSRILKIDASTDLFFSVAGISSIGFGGDGGPASAAELNNPGLVACDTGGNIYFVDGGNNRVRKIDIATNTITTVAGNGTLGYSGDGGQATTAEIGDGPICVDYLGNLYTIDNYGYRIRKVDPSGIITTVAGTGSSGCTGDGGPTTSATFNSALGINANSLGNVCVSDNWTGEVREINFHTGLVTRIAGTGDSIISPYSGDGGSAIDAHISSFCVLFDHNNNLFIGDETNNRIYKVDTSGVIHSIAGIGTGGYSGDGGDADSAEINWPQSIGEDQCGNIYIDDVLNHRIRKINFPSITTDSPHISITATPHDTLCHGTTILFSSTVTAGGSLLSYQWYKNNTAIGGATNSTYSYAPAPSDSVQCIVSAGSPCHGSIYGYSNVIVPVFSPIVVPSIIITAHPGDTICEGSAVAFTALATGGGASLGYQWVVNGTVMGTDSTFSYTPSAGDSVYCAFTSSASCASPAVVKSAAIHIVVVPTVRTTVTIGALPGGTVCAGTPVVFTAVATSGGSAPRDNWFVNGVWRGSGSTYTYPPLNGDSIVCTMVSNIPCAAPDTTTSNLLIMAVDTLEVPEISISAPLEAAIGSIITVTATVANAGSAFTIEWMNHGAVFSTTSTLTTSYLKTDTLDVLTAKVVPADYCYDSSLSSPQTVADNTTSTPILSNAPKNVTCYPNPVTSKLYLTADMSINSVAITDLLGQVALQATTAGEKAAIIDVKELRPGVYFVKVNNLWVVKFIKE